MIWLFDIDGTLIRCGGAGSAAMAAALTSTFDVEGDTSSISFAGRTDYSIIRDLFAAHDIPVTAEHVQDFVSCYLEILPRKLAARAGRVLPGVERWLERLSQHPDCRIGIVTGNLQAAAQIKLEHFGLECYFETGGYGDEHESRCGLITDALGKLGHTSPPASKHVWAVGDTPHDIRAAHEVGIRVIAVATGGYDAKDLAVHEPEHVFESLANDSFLNQIV